MLVKLLEKIESQGLTVKDLAERTRYTGAPISELDLFRKIENVESLTSGEINSISLALGLTTDETLKIFFDGYSIKS